MNGWWIFLWLMVSTQLTIACVTLYLHRSSAHGAVKFHPAVEHLMRFWLWLGSGINTREWTAIHRKHHAACETSDDPHSPRHYGILKVLLEGYELYHKSSKDKELLERYGRGTPNDWMERNVYSRFGNAGLGFFLVAKVLAFGPIGLTVWAIQMVWIPIMAAGIINGMGHWKGGYRLHHTNDDSLNLVPWAFFIGGEELHNNHHAFPSSAKLSNGKGEFDIGWLYITVLSKLGLAKVSRVAPPLVEHDRMVIPNDDWVQWVGRHRQRIMRLYGDAASQAIKEVHSLPVGLHQSWQKVLSSSRKRQSWLSGQWGNLTARERQDIAEGEKVLPLLARLRDGFERFSAIWKASMKDRDAIASDISGWFVSIKAMKMPPMDSFLQTISRSGTIVAMT